MFKCLYPDCGYVAEAITKNHYHSHGATKAEIEEKYGKPQYLQASLSALRKNNVYRKEVYIDPYTWMSYSERQADRSFY